MSVPSLVDIFERLQEAMPAVSMALGLEYVDENVQPPRIVLVPTDDEDLPYSRSDPLGSVQRSVGTVAAGVEVYLWGAGAPTELDKYAHIRATEALRNLFLYQVHQVAPGNYRRLGGRWQDASLEQFGRGYIQRLQFLLPIVPDVVDITTAQILATQVAGGATFPAGDVATPTPAP